MHRSLRRSLAVVFVVGAFIALTPTPASAARPRVQACVGETFSVAAHQPGPLGPTIRAFAQAPDDRPGLGEGIQGVQAGLVPDAVAVNFCN